MRHTGWNVELLAQFAITLFGRGMGPIRSRWKLFQIKIINDGNINITYGQLFVRLNALRCQTPKGKILLTIGRVPRLEGVPTEACPIGSSR